MSHVACSVCLSVCVLATRVSCAKTSEQETIKMPFRLEWDWCALTHTHTQPFYCWSGICPGPPGSAGTRKVKPRRLKPIWIYWSKRQWHLLGYMQDRTPCRQPCQHPTTQFFYRPDALLDAQPTASKHWRHEVPPHFPLFSMLSFHSLSLLIRSSSISTITTKSSAYNNSHGKATLNSLPW